MDGASVGFKVGPAQVAEVGVEDGAEVGEWLGDEEGRAEEGP